MGSGAAVLGGRCQSGARRGRKEGAGSEAAVVPVSPSPLPCPHRVLRGPTVAPAWPPPPWAPAAPPPPLGPPGGPRDPAGVPAAASLGVKLLRHPGESWGSRCPPPMPPAPLSHRSPPPPPRFAPVGVPGMGQWGRVWGSPVRVPHGWRCRAPPPLPTGFPHASGWGSRRGGTPGEASGGGHQRAWGEGAPWRLCPGAAGGTPPVGEGCRRARLWAWVPIGPMVCMGPYGA